MAVLTAGPVADTGEPARTTNADVLAIRCASCGSLVGVGRAPIGVVTCSGGCFLAELDSANGGLT